jgi:hypothetical protein
MKIIITEIQERIILLESSGEELGNTIKENTEKAEKFIEKAQNQMGINLKFLLTWGAGIGGFIGPVESFIKGRYPTISDLEITLILIGILSTYFFENKKFLREKVLSKITENKLNKKFDKILEKTDQLKDTFSEFINSLGVTFHSVTNMLSYMFILPIIPMIIEMVKSGITEKINLEELSIRIIGFAGLTIVGIKIKDFLEFLPKIIKRFKSK